MEPLIVLGLLAEYFGIISGSVGAIAAFATKNVWLRPVGKFFYRTVYKNLPHVRTQDKLNKLLDHCLPGEGPSIFDITLQNQTLLISIDKKIVMMEGQIDLVNNAIGLYKFITNEKGEIIKSSDSLNHLLGVDEEHCLMSGYKSTIFPSDLDHYAKNWNSAILDARDFICDVRLRNMRDGTVYECRVTASTIKHMDVVIGWIGFIKVLSCSKVCEHVDHCDIECDLNVRKPETFSWS